MLQRFDQRNRDLIVNINGGLLHRDKGGIGPFDSAVQGGAGGGFLGGSCHTAYSAGDRKSDRRLEAT